ncbi:probable cytochrome P450 313a4 isoform X1 [Bactrocera tryoni]|uniref:probable cytochrome P450 313a4 isoform X1 n=1 Tax=Bactrocera tryoni TaxID=59916 RepID=UPI001A95ABC7|nr:probable cytochrome P450 313a4 isoform X1 [Bactrocera tryoni]
MSAIIGVETLIITVIILLLSASWRLYQKRKYYSNVTSKLPIICGIPLIGAAYHVFDVNKLFNNISNGFDIMKTLTGCMWVAATPYVLTIDTEVIKNVTTSPEFLNKAPDLYTQFHNDILNGLIVSPAKKWKISRKALNPFLAHNNIVALFPAFNQNANNVKNKLARLAGQGEQDIFNIIKDCGLQLSLLTIVGLKLEEGSEKHRETLRAFNALADHMAMDLVLGWLGLGFLSRTPHYKRVVKSLRKIVQSLVEENLSKPVDSDDINNFEKDNKTLIDLALRAFRQGVFSAKDMEVECFTMIAASYETSVGAAYTCLVLLAMHPEIQERLFQEICSVFPDEITSVEYDDLKKLPYLDMCVSEALRLVPPAAFIGRQTVHDTELCPGVILPKGTQVLLAIYVLHRRKEIWGPDAHRFNPDNFLPENVAKRHPYSYMPFSKGPRNCIAARYAQITLRIILIHTLRRLKFSTTFKYEDIILEPKVTLGFKIEPPLNIEVRTN